ncbi:MAG: hypothetical protein Q8L48_22225 [Archangium sp.]|nr:hypothetical protein [Archangium sp.]
MNPTRLSECRALVLEISMVEDRKRGAGGAVQSRAGTSMAARLAGLVMLAACSAPPTYLDFGTQRTTPHSVCSKRIDAGWIYASMPTAWDSPGVRIGELGSTSPLSANSTCGASWDCRYFYLRTVDAGHNLVEWCDRSRVTVSRGADGGDVVEAIAWCPSRLVRLRADVTGPCPP